MSLLQDIYKNFGDIDAMHKELQDSPEMPRQENIYNYTKDNLLRLGAAKQAAIDEHNDLLDSQPSSFVQAIGDFWQHDTLTGVAVNKVLDGPQLVDPEFDPNQAFKSVEDEFLVPSDKKVLLGARNEDHFNLLADNLRDYNEHRLNVERLGFPKSIAAQLFAEVGNVINWVPFLNVTKAGKLLKYKDIAKGAALQGTANVTEEKLIDMAYKDRTVSDYVASFALGAGLSGSVLGASKLWNTTKFETGQRINDEAAAFAAHRTKDKADETIATAKGGPKPNRDWTDSTILRDDEGKLDPTISKKMEEKGYDPENEMDIWVENYEAQGLLPKATQVIQEKLNLAGFAQTLAGSDNPFFRALNRALFEHGEGGLGVHKEHTAALEADLETQRIFSNYSNQLIQSKAAFAVEAEKVGMTIKDFDRVAYRYIDSGGTIGYDGKINYPGRESKLNDILEDFRQVYTQQDKTLRDHIKSAGVYEADTFGEGPHLLRKYDNEQFLKLTQEFGSSKPIKDLIRESLTRGKGFNEYSKKVLDDIETKYQEELSVYDKKLSSLEADLEVIQMQIKKAKDFTKQIQAEARYDKALKKIEAHKETKPTVPEVADIDTSKVIQRVSEAVYNRMYRRAYTHDADANLLSTNNQTLLLEALEDLKADGGLDQADIDHVQGILATAGRDRKADPTKGRLIWI
jgi:hypothetical protein